MKNPNIRIKIIAAVLLAAAVGLAVIGMTRKHRVYDRPEDVSGPLTYEYISEASLVADSTFSGVEREDDRLYSTYDRTEERGKSSCPT